MYLFGFAGWFKFTGVFGGFFANGIFDLFPNWIGWVPSGAGAVGLVCRSWIRRRRGPEANPDKPAE